MLEGLLGPAAIDVYQKKLDLVLKAEATHQPSNQVPQEIHQQPIHVVYGGAHLFKAETTSKLTHLALQALQQYAPDASKLRAMLDLDHLRENHQKSPSIDPISDEAFAKIYDKVITKLQNNAIEDYRIDFEDGYGHRPDLEEDHDAEKTAQEVSKGMASNSLPPLIGLRIKSFSQEVFARSVRTLDIFLSTLAKQKSFPFPLIVTLPKVIHPIQVSLLAELLENYEKKLNLPKNSLLLELMIETPQSLIRDSGYIALPGLVDAAHGRCFAVHLGTYDYTAAIDITAHHQTMMHPSCNFAKHIIKVSLAGRSVYLSDGATNMIPVAPYRQPTNDLQKLANIRAIQCAWQTSYQNINHSLANGFYQGWDLHPAQIPIRYACVYAFFYQSLPLATARLKSFIEKGAQANLVGNVFDDAASAQGLLNFFIRGIKCGALSEIDLVPTGLTSDEIAFRSFLKIITDKTARLKGSS